MPIPLIATIREISLLALFYNFFLCGNPPVPYTPSTEDDIVRIERIYEGVKFIKEISQSKATLHNVPLPPELRSLIEGAFYRHDM